MAKLLKNIKKKATRLQDITNVLQKLEKLNYVDRLSKLYQEIFYEEQKFTIMELQRIIRQKPGNKYLDIGEQFEQNAQLFKANFEAINTIIMNEVWETASSSFAKHVHEGESSEASPRGGKKRLQQNEGGDHQKNNQEDNGNAAVNPEVNSAGDEDDEQYLSGNDNDAEGSGQISSSGQLQFSMQKSGGKASSNKVIRSSNQANTPSNLASSMHNTSSFSANNSFASGQQGESWIRKSLKQRNQSRSQESLRQSTTQIVENSGKKATTMTGLMNNSTSSMLGNKSSNNMSIQDIRRQSERKMSNTNLSMMSNKELSASKLSMTSPFSELPGELKNPLQTSFSRAQRRLTDKEMSQSPGPLDYRTDKAEKLVRNSSPKHSFGSSKRTNFIDEKQRVESCSSTPGPHYNVSQTGIYKPFRK